MTLTDSYQLDLSCLHLGSRVGIMRSADSTLHYYLDGIDQGVACCNVPSGQLLSSMCYVQVCSECIIVILWVSCRLLGEVGVYC